MNNKIDWTKKLASRKFWIAIVGVIGAIGAFVGLESGTTEQITTIIMSFGTLIAYILAEGFIDGKREENNISDDDLL